MTSAVAKDFLTVPGIASLAVMDGSMPVHHFYGIDQSFTAKQQSLLSEAITGVLGSIPEDFTSFEFRWRTYYTYLHRIDYAAVLMVVTIGSSLDKTRYQQRIQPFLQALQSNREEALQQLNAAAQQIGILDDSPNNQLTEFQGPEEPPCLTNIELQTILNAFNSMAQCVAYYLGKTVTTNQLKNSCPDPSWTAWVDIDRHAKLIIRESPTRPLTAIEYQQWQCWAQRFLQNSGKVLRNLTSILDRQLTDAEKELLRL
jgi:hypothetical protein